MSVQVVLSKEQLLDLGVIRDLGAKTIQTIIEKWSSLAPPPIKPSDLRTVLAEIMPNRSLEVDIILRQLMSLYTLRRQRNMNVTDLIEGLQYGISKADTPWSEKEICQWNEIQPQLKDLFSLQTVWNVIKALDLSYDYTNIFQSAKIITDIRPVFNEEASDIQGAIISFTLRLYYDSLEGGKNISIALDEMDVNRFRQECERALEKARVAKAFVQKSNIKNAFIVGEEGE